MIFTYDKQWTHNAYMGIMKNFLYTNFLYT